jgi:IclR family pca regulon transcriptional regulator
MKGAQPLSRQEFDGLNAKHVSLAVRDKRAASTPKTDVYVAKHGDPDFMESLARGLRVMQSFTRTSPRLTSVQVSAATGLSRAAVRRCLHTLHQLGFVDIEDTKYFSLAPRVLTLSHAYSSSSRLPRAAQPILEKLSGILNESCSVAILDNDEVVYVARAHVSRIMTVDLVIGSRLPAYCTSMGRVLLANLGPERLRQYLKRVELQRHTSRTITSLKKLQKVLETVRHEGFAMVDQELEEGLRSLAVPVRAAAGEVVAAMNIGTQAQRMPIEEVESRFLPHLLSASRNLSQALR